MIQNEKKIYKILIREISNDKFLPLLLTIEGYSDPYRWIVEYQLANMDDLIVANAMNKSLDYIKEELSDLFVDALIKKEKEKNGLFKS